MARESSGLMRWGGKGRERMGEDAVRLNGDLAVR